MDNMQRTILFVDDEVNILNALQRLFRREGYSILTATNGSEGLELIKKNKVALVISDNMMPVMDGIEFLAKVKEASADTVRFMLTGYADIKSVVAAINRGEVSRYVTKPWNDDDLKFAVAEALQRYDLVSENKRLQQITQEQNRELAELNRGLEAKVAEKTAKIRENFFAFVKICTDIMELYDPLTGGHSKRVASLAKGLAAGMSLEGRDADLIEAAALLHNIGLIGVPRSVLNKDEEQLSESEKAVIRHSPILTQSLFSTIDTLGLAGPLIRSHMERFDGRGYPDGLKKTDIPLGSRIIAACKLYDRARLWQEDGKIHINPSEYLLQESGKALDPEVVKSFIDIIDKEKGASSNTRKVIPLSNLTAGLMLEKDIITVKGRLLVSKGTLLSVELIDKVRNFNKMDPIAENICVRG